MEKPKLWDAVAIAGTVWRGRILSLADGLAVVRWDGEEGGWGQDPNPVAISDLMPAANGWEISPKPLA